MYTGLDQRSTEELCVLANHISSQLQGTPSLIPAVTIATDDGKCSISKYNRLMSVDL